MAANAANNASMQKFFKNSDLTPDEARKIVAHGLQGADYGEFFQQVSKVEMLSKTRREYDDVNLGSGASGFGFRVGIGEAVGYSFSDVFNKQALEDAVYRARQVLGANGGNPANPAQNANYGSAPVKLYNNDDPMADMSVEEKIKAIDEIEAFAYALSPNVENVSVTYSAASKDTHIINAKNESMVDSIPSASLRITVSVREANEKAKVINFSDGPGPVISLGFMDANVRTESGTAIVGGRATCKDVFNRSAWEGKVKQALKVAETLLIAEEAPSGIMDIVMAPGWGAVLLHEAVGHGLEGDFNRRGISAYSGKLGQVVAPPKVTVMDQGDLPGERGSIHFDDEGAPSRQNTLIEKGVLMGYMQDRQNAMLMGVEPTGNGRRQSYKHMPMPRMTNTYFANGPDDPAEIIKSVKYGLYISDMGGGQVDITSGKFNMNATLAWIIRDGEICEPVKGATIVGDGPSMIKGIHMVGNDLEIEKNAGVCGKDGQSVVVSCGQPTIKIPNMTVGGSQSNTPKP